MALPIDLVGKLVTKEEIDSMVLASLASWIIMAIAVASLRAINSVTILAAFSSIVTQFLSPIHNSFDFFSSTSYISFKKFY